MPKAKHNYTVLVVEDEHPIAEAIKKKLDTNGFTVVLARSVSQALEQLKNTRGIQGVWLDHYLIGGKSGLDLVAQMKSKKSKWKEIPIFVVSNTAGADKIRAYLCLGVDKYYTKCGFSIQTIINDIKKFLDRGESYLIQ